MLKNTLILYGTGWLAVALAIVFPALAWLSPLAFMVILPAGAVWVWKSHAGSLKDLGLRFSAGWMRRLGLGLLVGLAIPLLFQGLELWGGWIRLGPRQVSIQFLLLSLPLVLLRMLLVVGIEEFVFRGFFLQALGGGTPALPGGGIGAGGWAVIILSSLLWGAGHLVSMAGNGLAPGSIMLGMTSFLLWGVTQSLCFLKTEKSLWLPYGMHLGINLSFGFSLLGWFFSIQPAGPQWWIGHPTWIPESGLLGVVVWLVFALAAYLVKRKTLPAAETAGQPETPP